MKFLSDILAKAGLTVDGVVTLNNTATGQTPDANDNSTKLATTAWVRTFVQPYSLPIATASILGGIKVGSGLSINSTTGVLSVTGAGAASIKSTQTFVVTEGQTVFTVTGGYTPGLMDVFVNGVYLSPNQITATNGTTFTINDPAATGDIVDVIVVSAIYEGATTTTDQLPEGVVNLYYTNARARAAITLTTTGVSGAATYNSSTGVFNIPNYQGLVPAGGVAGDILAKVSGTNYDVTWIPNYTSQVQHIVKAGVAVTKGQAVYVSSADGTNMIVSKASNASEQTSSKTLGLVAQDLAINGQGFVVTEGLLAGLNTSTANAGDPVWLGTDGNLIFGLLNKPTAPAHLVFIGVVTRVQSNNGEIFVKVQNGFELDELHDLSVKNASDGDMIKYVASTGLWTKIAATTTNITEGTNLYYTQARFDTAFAAKSTTNLTEGTNLYYTTARANSDFDTRLATKSTTNLTEGTNLYYTTARANSDFDTRLATKSTTNLAEGTNLYYTDARVGTYLTANSYATQSYVSTQINNLVSGAPGLLDTLDELAAALGDDPNFATTVSTALSNRLRVDINNQGLTSTQQGNGRTNLGLGSLAVLSSVGNAQITDLAYSKLTGVPSTFAPSAHTHPISDITGLQTALDGKQASLSGTGFVKISGSTISYDNSTYYLASNPSGYITGISFANVSAKPTTIAGYGITDSLVYTTSTYSNPSWITALAWSKITGAPAFITGYTEVDTLSSVTGRGASTSTALTLSGGATITGLTIAKSAGVSTITFPAGFNDPAFIQHEETTNNLGIMRFSVSDDTDANDYFIFGGTVSGTYSGTFKLLSNGTVTLGTWQGTAIADTYISSAATWNAKQNALNGTGFVKISGTTISYDNNTYLTGITSTLVTNALGYTPYNAGSNTVLTNVNYTSYALRWNSTQAPANGLDNTGIVPNSVTLFDGYAAPIPGYPSGPAQWWVGALTIGDASRGFQIAGGYADSDMYFRKGNDTWAAWRKVWTDVNLTNLNQLTNGPGYITAETDTLATVTARGASTSTPITVTASEGREVAVYMPSSYTTNDLVSGHEYGWYNDHWRLGMTRSGDGNGADFVIQWNAARRLSLTNGGNLTVTGTISSTNFSGTHSGSSSGTNTGDQTLTGLGGVPSTRTLTIQGTALDLTANRSWDIYTIYGIGLGNTSMNQSYGSTHILRNENGLNAAVSYAPCLHAAAGDTMWQLQGTYGSTGDGTLYFRQGYNGSWGNWLVMLSASNYSNYAVPLTRTITINGTALDLSANRSWTVGNVTGSGTTNRIAYWDSSSSISFLDTASYPSLTELGYVKGVTSAIQTQLNSKQASLSDPIYYNGAVSTPGYAGANYDALTGSAYYRLNGGGDSRGVLVLNTGGSLGTLQLEASYNEGLRFRNKTDNATWNGFKRIIDTGNYRGLLAGGTISHDVVGDAVTWRIQNDNTGGYSTSMAFSVYGYTAPAGYFDVLRIQGSYPGFGRANFIVKNQYTSTELVAFYINGDGNTYSNYSITAANSMSSPTFANSTGYPYNTNFGQGADAAFSRLQAGSTNGYHSSVTVYGGGSPAGGNQIIMQTASANRLTIDNTYTYVLNNLMNEKYHRINGEDGAKRYEIIRGFDTGAVDEYWLRVEIPQYYYQQNSNDGKIVLEVQWNSVHASYHAYTKLEFNYHSVYWKSPSQLGLSNLKRTYTADFGGGTYYPASSQPRVDIYEKNDGYFYIRVKGNTTENNLNQRKTLRLSLLGKVGVEPTITMGVSAPTGGSFIADSYSLDSHNGNLYLSGDIENNSQVIGRGSTSAYSGTSYSSNYSLFLRANGLSTNGGDNDYSGIRFSNRNGSREQFFGVVQVASNRGDWVWQSYTGSQYQEGMRLYGNTHTLEVRGDVIAYGSPSDLRLKTIKEKVPNALDKIIRLNGYRFDWDRASDTSDIKEDIGVIAQEVEALFPELARTNEDGFMSVRYQGLTAVLIEAVKEQQTQIESQKSEIEELKDLVKQLINR